MLRPRRICRWKDYKVSTVPVSVYIITKNEASRIRRAVASVIEWADEVIVVDSGSTDQTVEIAESFGVRVFHRDWEGYGPHKRFAEEQCRNRWVLNIDADEEVSSALADEIQDAVNRAVQGVAAFRIKVTDVLPTEQTPRWHAYSYRILRLYHRDYGRMSNHPYQDRVELKHGQIQDLKGRIHHRSFVSWKATLDKINFYTSQVGKERAARGLPRLFTVRLWTEFPLTFFKIWFGRRFILRGSTGLAMSINIAYLNLMRLLKIQEAVQLAADQTPGLKVHDAA